MKLRCGDCGKDAGFVERREGRWVLVSVRRDRGRRGWQDVEFVDSLTDPAGRRVDLAGTCRGGHQLEFVRGTDLIAAAQAKTASLTIRRVGPGGEPNAVR